MNIHREGRLFLAGLLVGLALFNWMIWNYLPAFIFWILLFGSVCLFLFFLQFFRNPRRELTISEKEVVSPADGKVVIIEKIREQEFLNEEVIQISIFMSPVNVHINRVPIDGTVEYYQYHKGQYLVAFNPKSSTLNERNTTILRTHTGQRILLRQIAGAVARRLVYYLRQGQEVKQGQELGFIKFGSRMDVFLPVDAEIKVQLNQSVTGGQTIIASLQS
jgi:phosphatidylserine decarboxylase